MYYVVKYDLFETVVAQRHSVWVRFLLGGINNIHLNIWQSVAFSFNIQHEIFRKLSEKWGMKCLTTIFRLHIQLYVANTTRYYMINSYKYLLVWWKASNLGIIFSRLNIIPVEELLSIDVALIESVSKQVQYNVLPNTSSTMWKGRERPVTTTEESATADVVEYEMGTRFIECESSSIQYRCLKMYKVIRL